MSLIIGIAGLPNVGKSTLFNALTCATILAVNCPFATIESNVDVAPPPDPRLRIFAEMFHSEKVIPATVFFVDITGTVRGMSEGEGLGDQFLANIHEADTICQVTRAFSDPDVVYVSGKAGLASNIETIQTELTLTGMQTSEKQIPKLEKEIRGKKTGPIVLKAAREALTLLEKGELPSGPAGAVLGQDVFKSFRLMTAKLFIFAFNMDQAGTESEALQQSLRDLAVPAETTFFDAQFESELVKLDEEDVREMLEDSGQIEAGFDKFAHVGFTTFSLQTYPTAGLKEARAWTIRRGDTAPQTVGVIHIDLQRGFIKAETVSYDDLVELGGMQEVRAADKARMGGKDYVMADDNTVEFKFNM